MKRLRWCEVGVGVGVGWLFPPLCGEQGMSQISVRRRAEVDLRAEVEFSNRSRVGFDWGNLC